jgi:uncharacterized membrane protein YwzB
MGKISLVKTKANQKVRIKDLIKATLIMIITAIIIGTALNFGIMK